MSFVWVILEIILLFFLSNILKKTLFLRFYLFSKNQTATITFISLLLYPGVVVHEFSHLVAAVLLFVPVKDMTLIPKVVEGKIQGGSVVIQKVDVFRRTLVGIAPLFGGLAILWLITTYVIPVIPFFCHAEFISASEILKQVQDDALCNSNIIFLTSNSLSAQAGQLPITILSIYLIFSVSATMYSSQKDLEALLYTLPIGIVGIVLLYIVGFQASWVIVLLERFDLVFIQLALVLLVVLGIQLAVFLLLLLYSTFIKPTRSG